MNACGGCCAKSKALALFTSSIGKKFVVAVTGLLLVGFVFIHMAGNLLIIFSGADAYNAYGHSITSNPLYPLMGPGLLLIFIVHIVFAVWLSKDNRAARSTSYAGGATSGEKAASLASRTMIYSGSIVAAFLITHLNTFKYGTYYSTTVNGVEMRDLARLFFEVFQSPTYVAWYVLSLLLLGLHLKHGFAAAFQSLGFWHPRYSPALKCLAVLYAIVVVIGFISQPLFALLKGGG